MELVAKCIDRKGLLSFGCSLEQLELLGMLESISSGSSGSRKRLETSRHYRKINQIEDVRLEALP